MLPALKHIFGAPPTEYVSLSRTNPSARDAWAVVAARLAATDSSLLLVGVANGGGPLRPKPGARPSLLRDGRIAEDTAWQFRARTPDDHRQVTFWLSGKGALARRKQRITVFALDENGQRIRPRVIPDAWLDSPEIWNIVRDQPSFRPGRLPDLSSISLQIAEWFQSRRWCWIARCSFGDARGGAQVLIVLDAISGVVLNEELTRYANGVPVSKSAST